MKPIFSSHEYKVVPSALLPRFYTLTDYYNAHGNKSDGHLKHTRATRKPLDGHGGSPKHASENCKPKASQSTDGQQVRQYGSIWSISGKRNLEISHILAFLSFWEFPKSPWVSRQMIQCDLDEPRGWAQVPWNPSRWTEALKLHPLRIIEVLNGFKKTHFLFGNLTYYSWYS